MVSRRRVANPPYMGHKGDTDASPYQSSKHNGSGSWQADWSWGRFGAGVG